MHSTKTIFAASVAVLSGSLLMGYYGAYQNAFLFGVFGLSSIWILPFVMSRALYQAMIWIILALLFLVVPAIPKGVTEATHQASCEGKLQRISRALREYRNDHGHDMPIYSADRDGRPLHSWRVLLLPYLGESDLYEALNLDEPWNSAHNLPRLKESSAWVHFQCSSNVIGRGAASYGESLVADYIGIGTGQPAVGSGAAGGPMSIVQAVVMVTETAKSDIFWAEPRDLDVGPAGSSEGILDAVSSRHYYGVHVLVVGEGDPRLLPPQEARSLIEEKLRVCVTGTR